jgi:spoIIIJ-associated protein
VEWVETTGRTLEEAKDAALDQLGVDEQDAEFEVLEEARSGLFGRLRTEARVRARVRPTTPRPKVDRRERRRGGERERGRDRETAPSKPAAEAAPKRRPPAAPAPAKEERPPVDVDIDTQAANVRSFLDGLLAAFDASGEVTVSVVDEDTLDATVAGDDLGLLIGPKGQTLQAVQELTRAVLQKEGPGGPRLRLDVGGYRERRREALSRFTHQIAEQVLSSGTATSLEPMGAADRKVVHDTVNEIDGVRTISEGEEPRRRVVILPDDE